MRELRPYLTVHGLTKAIDNGGRFYNLFTAADDAVVSRGELAKAASVFSENAQVLLGDFVLHKTLKANLIEK